MLSAIEKSPPEVLRSNVKLELPTVAVAVDAVEGISKSPLTVTTLVPVGLMVIAPVLGLLFLMVRFPKTVKSSASVRVRAVPELTVLSMVKLFKLFEASVKVTAAEDNFIVRVPLL